jgi:hypothetical protein
LGGLARMLLLCALLLDRAAGAGSDLLLLRR